MHHHHMHVAIGVEDYDLAMSKHMVLYTVNEQNGLCPGESSWYFYIFIYIQ